MFVFFVIHDHLVSKEQILRTSMNNFWKIGFKMLEVTFNWEIFFVTGLFQTFSKLSQNIFQILYIIIQSNLIKNQS